MFFKQTAKIKVWTWTYGICNLILQSYNNYSCQVNAGDLFRFLCRTKWSRNFKAAWNGNTHVKYKYPQKCVLEHRTWRVKALQQFPLLKWVKGWVHLRMNVQPLSKCPRVDGTSAEVLLSAKHFWRFTALLNTRRRRERWKKRHRMVLWHNPVLWKPQDLKLIWKDYNCTLDVCGRATSDFQGSSKDSSFDEGVNKIFSNQFVVSRHLF